MASEIHRRRTGRGLKVSEDIVLKEEMYEEEEDDLPRHYKFLTAHLQTNSPEMNHRVNAFITTQTAMATMARYNEVNRLFNESFPSAVSYQQQLNNSMYMAPFLRSGPTSPAIPGTASTPVSPTTRPESASGHFQLGSTDRRTSTTSASPAPNPALISSPPALSPGSTATELADTKSTPQQTSSAFPDVDPQLAQQGSSSVFTSELPQEVKMLANIDMNDPMAMHFFGGTGPPPYPMFGQFPGTPSTQQPKHCQEQIDTSPESSVHRSVEHEGAFFSPVEDTVGFFNFPLDDYSRLGTPGGGIGGDSWDAFVDFGSEQ
ncbi:hypothetical protein F4778DRAFT_779346 [Xylariomycetidae sp. FL2044]|nr:hypothetical protein F4778DRAFT_779346 [Xylariomycetidae sp. FL2044]